MFGRIVDHLFSNKKYALVDDELEPGGGWHEWMLYCSIRQGLILLLVPLMLKMYQMSFLSHI